jgi:molybdopterin-containing oxidoreductase family membrane subunit
MKLSNHGRDVLKTLAPPIERTSTREWMWMLFLLALIGVGGYALVLQIVEGHIVTGMRDHVVWGLFIANFIFFIGISYAAAVLAAFMQLFQLEWRKPLMKMAAMLMITAGIIGPVFILLCMGRLDRLHNLILHGRLQSPITWDVLAISTFLVGGFIFLYLLSLKDFAVYRDSTDLNLPAWKRKFYRFMAINYQDTPEQRKQLNMSLNLISIIMIPLMVIVSSVLSWIFGMTLRPGWHSTIFGPYFVIASIYTGTGVLILLMWAFRQRYGLRHIIQNKHFNYLGYVMLVLGSAYGYFTFSEYLTDWYGSEKWTRHLMDKLFSWEEYGLMFMLTNICAVVVPIVIVAVPRLRHPKYIAIAAFIMVIAMWFRRYLIVVPTLETPLLPLQDTRPEYVHYSITWVEWAMTIAGIAFFLLLFTVVNKFMTIIPVSELKDPEEQSTHA